MFVYGTSVNINKLLQLNKHYEWRGKDSAVTEIQVVRWFEKAGFFHLEVL